MMLGSPQVKAQIRKQFKNIKKEAFEGEGV